MNNVSLKNLPPEEADLEIRINAFNAALVPLLGKYELGLAAQPRVNPDGRLVADPVILSVRKKKDVPTPPVSKADMVLANPED
jgi:hypothetical protein